MRGDVYRIAPRDTRGHEQSGPRFAVVVLASRFTHLSTWLVIPTSTSANAYVFRPQIEIPGHGITRALCDGLVSVDPERRLRDHVGYLSLAEMDLIDEALAGLLDLQGAR